MKNILNDLFLRFQKKGFIPIEIPRLIQDTSNILNKQKLAITDMNKELEDLGWGIDVMDNVTYELLRSLVK
jgi:hypothetical protein